MRCPASVSSGQEVGNFRGQAEPPRDELAHIRLAPIAVRFK